jgi:hypothetical protein
VHNGIVATNRDYPFIAYGTDWLAFAHLVIAVAFWGPLKDPVRNVWLVQFGMIGCAAVVPMALIAGAARGIPWWWQLIDMSFGAVGIIPLLIAYVNICKLTGSAGRRAPQAIGRAEPVPSISPGKNSATADKH